MSAVHPPQTRVSSAPWQQRYEDLRSYVGDGPRILQTDPLSLALLCCRGLAGWMRGWPEMNASRPSLAVASIAPQLPATPEWQEQLTVLLAQMTTQQLTE